MTHKDDEHSRYLEELKCRERQMDWPAYIIKPYAVQNILIFHSVAVLILYGIVSALIILYLRKRTTFALAR